MKARVLAERCQGHGMCHLACPEIFALDDEDGHAVVADAEIPPSHLAMIEKAAMSCPEQAIEIVNED